jgi:predicted RNase H-like HicB family nuclease
MRFQVVFEPSDEGGYTVYVPSLPGCISEGDTVEDALANIQEAIELYLEPPVPYIEASSSRCRGVSGVIVDRCVELR